MAEQEQVIAVLEAFNNLQKVLDTKEMDHVITMLGDLQNDIGTEGLSKLFAVFTAFNNLQKDAKRDVLGLCTAFNNVQYNADNALKAAERILSRGTLKRATLKKFLLMSINTSKPSEKVGTGKVGADRSDQDQINPDSDQNRKGR